MMEQMSLARIAQISDPFLRTTLITAAENIEKLMKTGKIGPATKLKSPTPHGLTIDIFVELKGDEKPDVYTLTYSLDQAALKQYLILVRVQGYRDHHTKRPGQTGQIGFLIR